MTTKECKYCGKVFPAKYRNRIYCSQVCKDIDYRLKKGIKVNPNPEPFHRNCVICGKKFETRIVNKMTCSNDCARKKHNRSGGKAKHRYEHTRVEWVEIVKARSEERKKTLETEKKFEKSLHTVERTCEICGETFYCKDTAPNKTCSKACSRKLENRRLDRRIPKEQIIDKDITVGKLFKRDGGRCYICGGNCSYDDWKISANGYRYPGDSYPEIDHVIPISRGGLHAWKNVRLSCRKCNERKSDAIISCIDDAPVVEKREQRKRTAQYTMDGTLVRIWDSTAQIKRELNVSDTYIQNVCRGEGKSAYGYKWAYVAS